MNGYRHYTEAVHGNMPAALHVIECSAHAQSKAGHRTAQLQRQSEVLESTAVMNKWPHVRIQCVPLLCSLLCCLLDFVLLEASQCARIKSARQQVTSAFTRQAMQMMHINDHWL